MPRTVKKDKHLQVGNPIKPASLSDRAAKEWDRMMGEIDSAGIQLTPAHRAALELAATIAADIADDRALLNKDGYYITTKAGLVAHPASKRLDALRRDFIKVIAMLGLRAAVAAPQTGSAIAPDDLLED